MLTTSANSSKNSVIPFFGWSLYTAIDLRVSLPDVIHASTAAGGRAGITFDVELVVPWDAPEAVITLDSDGLLDLDMVPDVIGLSGRRPEAAVCRILQGRDVRSVRALVPDPRGLEQNFHNVTIVDLGELPEVAVSIADLFLLREQWPPTVLRHKVWLQQDLDTMHAEARKRFRKTRPGRCSYCDKMIKCDMYRHVSTYQLWRCPVSWCRYGRVRHKTAWIMLGGHIMCRGMLSRPVLRSSSPHGQFGARCGWSRCWQVFPGYRRIFSSLVISIFR